MSTILAIYFHPIFSFFADFFFQLLCFQGYKNKSKKVKKGKQPSTPAVHPASVALDLFKQIPTAKIRELYDHYKLDFQIFGYTADQYYSTDKEWNGVI